MLGVWLGKLMAWLLRLTGRRATSLPGQLALRLTPRLLSQLGGQLRRCVIVTGTNGKTTTANLLAHMMEQAGPLVHNREGANLPQGLVTALLQYTSWLGRLRVSTALFEVDEATLPAVAACLPVKVAAVTNVFRDQLDRYGELDGALGKLLTGLRQTQAVLVLNADDPLAHFLGLRCGRPVVAYGMSRSCVQTHSHQQVRDGAFCLECGTRLTYDGFFYGQLGLYRCPACGFLRPHPDVLGVWQGDALEVEEAQLPRVRYHLPVRGLYNVYNALCAIACARVLGLNAEQIAAGLAQFQAPLGRMQAFTTRPPSVLHLVKNPAGCDSVLAAVQAEPGRKVVCAAIHDLAADGRDVSWLWDADFEQLASDPSVVSCVATGLRAEDMAVRWKYAGVARERIACHPDLAEGLALAFAAAAQQGATVHCLATYTALAPLADLLQRREQADASQPAYRPSVS
ncbi:MAG: MurT ligase domain-containing protein [Alicyclobacillus sp.]|nr:MurT ligase domain-containing protein [Alicyclobacillus sp.]